MYVLSHFDHIFAFAACEEGCKHFYVCSVVFQRGCRHNGVSMSESEIERKICWCLFLFILRSSSVGIALHTRNRSTCNEVLQAFGTEAVPIPGGRYGPDSGVGPFLLEMAIPSSEDRQLLTSRTLDMMQKGNGGI